jgi:hypothetical protein
MCDTSSVSAAQNSAVQAQIQITVLSKQQDAAKQAGAAAVAMLQSAVQIGKTLDTGKQLDIYA